MNFFRQLFSFSASKGAIFVIVSVLLSLAIWFFGPMLHFGQATPLLEVGTRVATILLMLALMLFVFLRWPISILGVTALCLLIWFGSPLVKIGEAIPFEAVWIRVLVIVVIVVVFVALLVKYYWNTLIQNQEFVQKLLAPKESDEGEEQILPVATELENKFHHTLEQLKELKVNKTLLHKLLAWNQYRYELPWYMFLGAIDSGKTTLALNSGLDFPQNPPIDIDYLENISATTDCDWWLSNSAVLIDPSGKFAAQDTLSEQPLNEWKTLLGLLHEHRPRTPINGVLLTLNIQDLIEMDAETLRKHAARLRLRMDEMRKKMEILFPVYLLVTKTDIMRGFNEYFDDLSKQGKEQVWGFTLPHQTQGKINVEQVKADILNQFGLLSQQLEHNLNERLNNETNTERNAKLYAFTDEFRSLEQKLSIFTSQLLVESKFDDTQQMTMLRGVYFTSSVQTALKDILANRQTLIERLKNRFSRSLVPVSDERDDWDNVRLPVASAAEPTFNSVDEQPDTDETRALAEVDSSSTAIIKKETDGAIAMPKPRYRLHSAESYFTRNLFAQLILAETHLVRPNLRWEYQNRLKKIFGNTALGLGFVGLVAGMLGSAYNNKGYLKAVAEKTTALEQKVDQYQSNPSSELIPAILDASETLPRYSTLKLDDPSWDYRWGLYTGTDIKNVSEHTYHQLQDSLLLPYINQRLETSMVDGLRDKNSDKAYNALRIYLLLHDAKRYTQDNNATDVRNWVHQDVDNHDVGVDFAGNSAVGSHIKAMFDGKRVIQVESRVNSDLVNQVRLFLNSSPPTQRLYERAKGSMLQDAPSDISLQSILGDKAVQLFALKDGKTIDKGVSGIYTVEGYKRYFGIKLLEFIKRAQKDDAWVMGQTESDALANVQESAEALAEQFNSPQMREIRKLYLTEYARAWQDFVNNIQLAPDTSGGMNGFVYEINTAKALVSADSPLSKLLRTIVKETSPTAISPVPQNAGTSAVDSKVTELQTSANELQKNAQALGRISGLNDLKLERELIEAPFAGLREIVTGSPYAAGDPAAQLLGTNTSSPLGKLSLDNANALIGEYYNALVTIDNAARTGAMPASVDTFAKLKLEADKYPAPLSNILATLGQGGQRKLTLLIGEALNRQFQEQVGQFCWQTMAGRYPFDRNSMNEVLPDDFANLFGPNGLYNQFFQKNLASIVDANVRPWRYKLQADGSPMMGPPLDSFEQAAQIRQQFFGAGGMDSGGANTRMSLRMNVAVTTMDPDIAQLMINMDGQGQRYAHGPVVPMSFVWPGTRGGTAAEILAESLTGGNLPAVGANGAWALFRLIDKAKVKNEVSANRLSVSYELGGRGVMLEFSTQGSANPLTSNILQTFNCPRGQALSMPAATLPNTPVNITPAGQVPINPRTGKPLTVSP